MKAAILQQDFLCTPDHVVDAIEARAGVCITVRTLRAWRYKEMPEPALVLPCSQAQFRVWLAAFMQQRRKRYGG